MQAAASSVGTLTRNLFAILDICASTDWRMSLSVLAAPLRPARVGASWDCGFFLERGCGGEDGEAVRRCMRADIEGGCGDESWLRGGKTYGGSGTRPKLPLQNTEEEQKQSRSPNPRLPGVGLRWDRRRQRATVSRQQSQLHRARRAVRWHWHINSLSAAQIHVAHRARYRPGGERAHKRGTHGQYAALE
jgi:hypothetical protein